MTVNYTLSEVTDLTTIMIRLDLSNEQNYPSTRGNQNADFEITINNSEALTVALKNVSYAEIYNSLAEQNCFNMKLIDGALVCLRYRFSAGKVIEHNLAYFPSPDMEHFQNDTEPYLADDIYADVVARNIVPFPIRFDFNADTSRYIDVQHPYSHLTLGQYQNCRIPVCSPVSPLVFGSFILRNFYNTAEKNFSDDIPTPKYRFDRTISANEQQIPHVVLMAPDLDQAYLGSIP